MVTLALKTRRRVLVLLNAALLAFIALAIAWAAMAQPQQKKIAVAKVQTRPADVEKSETNIKPLSFYLSIVKKPLRKSFVDAPKAATTPIVSAARKASFRANLIGTAIDEGGMYAIFLSNSGEETLVTIGETIEGAELIKVEDHSATLKLNNELMVLELPKVQFGFEE